MKYIKLAVVLLSTIFGFGCSGGSSGGGGSTPDPVVDPGTDPQPNNDRDAIDDVVDASLLERCTIFPSSNPWNTDISQLDVHPNSDAYIRSIGLDEHLQPDVGTVFKGAKIGIPFNIVRANTAAFNVDFQFAEESDAGPYPIPEAPRIEEAGGGGGDFHLLSVDVDDCKLYELLGAKAPDQPGANWTAISGAIFDLTINTLRADYNTSADGAGLPIFPGLIRYDEVVEKGVINHALRFTAGKTQQAFIHPATHFTQNNLDLDLPPMGLRVRLKADFDISGFSAEAQVILTALKKYGMLLADNGGNWFITGAPDSRWDDDHLHDITDVPGSAFEAVDTGALITGSVIP